MFVLTIVNVVIVSLAAFGAVHHMESAEFCGTTCHTTMEPEWKAYQVSAHAEVPCVACHVGSGAEALVTVEDRRHAPALAGADQQRPQSRANASAHDAAGA